MLSNRLSIFLTSQSLLRILRKQFLYQVLQQIRRVLGKSDITLPDQFIEFSLSFSIKRRYSCIQLINDYSKFIPVSHSIVPFLVDYLERKISWGAAERFIQVIDIVYLFGEAEISDQSVPIFIQDYIFWLKVSIYDVVFMKGLYSQQNFTGIVSHIFLLEFLLLFEQLREISSLAIVHHQKKIGFCLKSKSQLDNEWMIEETQDLLLCLDITIYTCPEYTLLPDSFQGIESYHFSFLDKIDLPEGPFSYLFVEFKAAKSDIFYFLILSNERIHLEYILFTPELHVLTIIQSVLLLLPDNH